MRVLTASPALALSSRCYYHRHGGPTVTTTVTRRTRNELQAGLCFTWLPACFSRRGDGSLGVASLRLAASLSHVNAIEDLHGTGSAGQSLNASCDGLSYAKLKLVEVRKQRKQRFRCGDTAAVFGFNEDNRSLVWLMLLLKH